MRSPLRIVTLSLALATAGLGLPDIATAATTGLRMSLPSPPPFAGERVTVPIFIDVTGASLGAYSLEIECDGTDVEIETIAGGSAAGFTTQPTQTITDPSSGCGARFNAFQTSAAPSGELHVATLEVLLKDGAEPPSLLTLTARSLFSADAAGGRLPDPAPNESDLPIQPPSTTPEPPSPPTTEPPTHPIPQPTVPAPEPTDPPTSGPTPKPQPTAIVAPEEIVAIIEQPTCRGVSGISNVQGIVYTTLKGAEIERLVNVIFDEGTEQESRINVPCCSDRGDAEVLLSGFSAVFNWCLLEPGVHTITLEFQSTTGRTLNVTREFVSYCATPDETFIRQEEFNWRTEGTGCASEDGGIVVCTPAADICDGEMRYEWSQATQSLVLKSNCEADGFAPAAAPSCSNEIQREYN